MSEKFAEYQGKKYDARHGGPFDRGGADAYYRRPFNPHCYIGDTYNSQRVTLEKGTPEYEAYTAGWNDAIDIGGFKDYGE